MIVADYIASQDFAPTEVTAQNASEAGRDDSSARSQTPEICMIVAGPRSRPKPLPEFPNPAGRPEGSLPPLVLEFFSEVPKGLDIALGKVRPRNTEVFLSAIRAAG